jgi:aspartate/glutamate racemase
MATAGVIAEEHRQVFFEFGRELYEREGAETVLLGRTGLFLAFENHDCGFPTLDLATIHVQSIVAAARA